VVFTADFTVTAGVQYDRTASIYLGHANIFYGTTSEPGPTLSPSWHVERDVTDLSALFACAQSGEADIYNIVNSTYTGVIYANAALEFYPASSEIPAPTVPSLVLPIMNGEGGAGVLGTTYSKLKQPFTLPKNVERVYLDVISQSQSNDEFWYTCVPNALTGPLESCGDTAFRETEISIDGIPAGVAPVSAWVFTGGIDPDLWIPIPGVQTLDFKPYRVDLTPFAGALSDGKSHLFEIGVYNADSYFLATANLLVYTDPGASVVTGALTTDTLSQAPSPSEWQDLQLDSSGNGHAWLKVASTRIFTISGYVNTSHGKVTTTLDQNIDFVNYQTFTLSPTTYNQNIVQVNSAALKTTTTDAQGTTVVQGQVNFPINMDIGIQVNPDGSESQTTTSDQVSLVDLAGSGVGGKTLTYSKEEVKSADTLNFDAGGNFTGNTGTESTATDEESNEQGEYYYLGLTAKGNVLTKIATKP